jgi:hypothetical protein
MSFSFGDPDLPSDAAQTHELRVFVDQVSNQLAAEYRRIRSRASEDPGTAGDEGEENWRDLFEDWLPPELHVVTKGRILGQNGVLSPQVDVLVLRPGYPRSLRNKKTYLAGGVLAAFECKLTLKPEHIREAANTAAAIRELVPERHGTPHDEAASPLLYGVLAHSTSIRRNPEARIDDLLAEGFATAATPAHCINVLCVADLATRQLTNILMVRRSVQAERWDGIRSSMDLDEEGGIRGFYMRWLGWPGNEIPPQPLYTLIQHLLHHAAWETPVYRALAQYWDRTAAGGSTSVCARTWPLSILSERVCRGIEGGRVESGDPWSPWGMML